MTPDGKQGLCLGNTCVTRVEPEISQNLTFDIVIKYPVENLGKFGGSALYIRGTGLGLKWTKGVILTQFSSDTWTLRMVYQSSILGFQCQDCPDKSYLDKDTLEYRIFVDDIKDMLGSNFAIHFPISAASSFFNDKPTFVDYPWFFTKNGEVSSYQVDSLYIGQTRNLALYTPPSFKENTLKKYPVLLVFDLEPQFAAILQYVFEVPIYPATIAQEFILIGFGDFRGPHGREDLLTPTSGVQLECINGTLDNKCDGCLPDNLTSVEWLWYMKNKCGKPSFNTGLGEQTLDFLVQEALPKASELTSNRTSLGNVGIMGYSLGGLMACHAVWTRPDVFSFAACQSPSFWWPMNNDTLVTCDFAFNNKTLKDPLFSTNRPEQRIYIDAGGLESDDPYRLTQAAIEAAYAISTLDHYELNKNVWIEVSPERAHNSLSWAVRVYKALRTLLPVPGSAGKPTINSATLVG